jgi:hypothetical protein
MAAIVLGLGLYTVGAGLRQAAAPPRACIEVDQAAPDSLHSPGQAYLHLTVCPVIDGMTLEAGTELDAELYNRNDTAGRLGTLFTGQGPPDPGRWAVTLKLRWLAADTIEVRNGPEVTLVYHPRRVGPVHVLYSTLGDSIPLR